MRWRFAFVRKLAGQDDVLVLRSLAKDGAIELEMRFRHLVGHAGDPLIERDILVAAGLEHFEEDEVFRAGVFDAVAGHAGHVAYIVGVEVHGAGFGSGGHDGHAALAAYPVLPLAYVGVPVHLANGAGLEGDHGCGDSL